MFTGRTDAEAEAPILWPPDELDSFEKTLMLGKIEARRRRGQQRMRWLDDITESMDVSLWKRLMRVPRNARRSNKPILKEISPECSLEGLMLKLKFQYFGHLM